MRHSARPVGGITALAWACLSVRLALGRAFLLCSQSGAGSGPTPRGPPMREEQTPRPRTARPWQCTMAGARNIQGWSINQGEPSPELASADVV